MGAVGADPRRDLGARRRLLRRPLLCQHATPAAGGRTHRSHRPDLEGRIEPHGQLTCSLSAMPRPACGPRTPGHDRRRLARWHHPTELASAGLGRVESLLDETERLSGRRTYAECESHCRHAGGDHRLCSVDNSTPCSHPRSPEA